MDDLDALKQFVQSEGWQMYRRHFESQWSDTFVLHRLRSAASGIPAGDEPSNHETARNLLAAQDAVMGMLAWPEQQIAALSKNQQPQGHQTVVQRFFKQVGR